MPRIIIVVVVVVVVVVVDAADVTVFITHAHVPCNLQPATSY
jgi:hypothetical protein